MEKRFYAKTASGLAFGFLPEVEAFHSLRDLLGWALTKPKGIFQPGIVGAVVVQDEYTHDLVVPLADGSVLVFETT